MPNIEFEGKWNVYAAHLITPFRPLEPDSKKSLLNGRRSGRKPSIDENLIIHGDNLHALRALLPRYGGRVNCIYIDPPYNTGKEGWCYNDNLNSPLMKRWLQENEAVDLEDEERHDKWLCMMWPRLQLLRELLAEDGAIFVSIDDNEQHRLRMVMDEIFGEDNFVANIIWQKKYAPANDAKHFSDNHDFIICYAKRKEKNGNDGSTTTWQRQLLPRTEKQDRAYKYDDDDGKGRWRPDNLTAKTYSEEYDYPIVNPHTKEKHYPAQGTCWRTNKTKMQQWIAENRVFFGRDGKGAPQLKRYLSEVQTGVVPLTIWPHAEVGHTDSARKAIKSIFPRTKLPFDNPKPPSLLKQILTVAMGKEGIVLDSFAGSGTAAQAVLELNKEDGGNRKFILVECEEYADKITAERIRRVIKGVKNAKDENLKQGLGGEFTYCTLGEPLSIESMLTGDTLPDYDTVARCIAHNFTGTPLDQIKQGKDWLFAETSSYRLHLIYEPDLTFLENAKDASLTFELAERIGKAAVRKGKEALVFAPHKFMSQKDLRAHKVTFCQLPWAIFGTSG